VAVVEVVCTSAEVTQAMVVKVRMALARRIPPTGTTQNEYLG
jgi:hypothetical protein